MLTTTFKLLPKISAHKYLSVPDINHNKWKTRGNNETHVILCDKEILLTEELKTYLLYFAYVGNKLTVTTTAFSNLPIKNQ